MFFEATNTMAVSELVNEFLLKFAFFEISIVVSVCIKFQYLDIQSFVLETDHTLRLVFTRRV